MTSDSGLDETWRLAGELLTSALLDFSRGGMAAGKKDGWEDASSLEPNDEDGALEVLEALAVLGPAFYSRSVPVQQAP